ncbi:MAG: HEAT repeat domain-containing protein, partial [Candidatus Saccharimonadales bacterium]
EHPSPEHTRLLLPALQDKQQSVVLAAVKALGHPGVLDDTAPLERLLAAHDQKLRLAVTQSLILLKADRGPEMLELLAHDPNADTRRQAALMMGRFADARYTDTLIGLLDDTLGVRLAALASLPRVVGHDAADAAADTNTLDRIGCWKQWWEHDRPEIADGHDDPPAAQPFGSGDDGRADHLD